MTVTHQRIHRANDTTWCGLRIVWQRKTPLTNVVTISEEAHKLTSVRYTNGQIDYTPLTDDEKNIVSAERERLNRETTCKRCRRIRGYK